jgi:hypothetical protein
MLILNFTYPRLNTTGLRNAHAYDIKLKVAANPYFRLKFKSCISFAYDSLLLPLQPVLNRADIRHW